MTLLSTIACNSTQNFVLTSQNEVAIMQQDYPALYQILALNVTLLVQYNGGPLRAITGLHSVVSLFKQGFKEVINLTMNDWTYAQSKVQSCAAKVQYVLSGFVRKQSKDVAFTSEGTKDFQFQGNRISQLFVKEQLLDQA